MVGYIENHEYDKFSLDDLIERFAPEVASYIRKEVEEFKFDLVSLAGSCESPIEQLLALHINRLNDNRRHLCILPQVEVETKGGKFRIDLLVLIIGYPGRDIEVLIECDGHDFHEKTKAQAARDKQRDRVLVASGYTVLHFTGSEIWRNPSKCAREVLDTLDKMWRDHYGADPF